MGKLFGTDGIRGIANQDLNIELATKVGIATGYVLGKDNDLVVVIGRDTRESGQMLLYALCAGLISYGAKVIDLGIIPTPAVSYLVKKYKASMGIMISASHNPSEYNGIKLFNNEGFKLSDEIEEEIEKYILENEVPKINKIGSYEISSQSVNDYVDYLASHSAINNNLKIVVDTANGSASVTAPILFDKIGIKATIINTNYDGININKSCGSTHLDGLIKTVLDNKADVGIAYDGDADRCLMVDDKGNVIDGDYILAICGLDMKDNKDLSNNTIVGTVMSNLGLRKFCEANSINFVATKVGDRYVLENMLDNNYSLGGEQSGHIIFKKLANTGDGELTSIIMLNVLSKSGKKLSSLASCMKSYPQILVNVNVSKEGKEKYKDNKDISNLINKYAKELNDDGRILIRPSGTENLVRVMIEGKDISNITKKANDIANLIRNSYGN